MIDEVRQAVAEHKGRRISRTEVDAALADARRRYPMLRPLFYVLGLVVRWAGSER